MTARSPMILFLAISIACASRIQSQTQSLDQELNRLKVDTALVVSSRAIDETPLWSRDSQNLAFNMEEKWYSLDLSQIKLVHAKLHEKAIPAISSKPHLEEITQGTLEEWKKDARSGDLQATTKSGIKVEFIQKNLSTTMVLTRAGKSVNLWSTGMETCGAPSISPSEKFVAYICELNGVLVTDIEAALKNGSYQLLRQENH
jgi:hypothetical protein